MRDLNVALMRIFGLKNEDFVTEFSLEVSGSHAPQLTVTSVIVPGSPQADRFLEQTQLFELVLIKDPAPAQRPALDLDAMCSAALERLWRDINDAAEAAQRIVRAEFKDARRRSDRRHDYAIERVRLTRRANPFNHLVPPDHPICMAPIEGPSITFSPRGMQ